MSEQAISEKVGTRLLFENERVRVWDLQLAPGQSTGMHRHVNDYLYVVIGDGSLQAADAVVLKTRMVPSKVNDKSTFLVVFMTFLSFIINGLLNVVSNPSLKLKTIEQQKGVENY